MGFFAAEATILLCEWGSTLEALDVNPLMYEYLFDKAWRHTGDDATWIPDAYADVSRMQDAVSGRLALDARLGLPSTCRLRGQG